MVGPTDGWHEEHWLLIDETSAYMKPKPATPKCIGNCSRRLVAMSSPLTVSYFGRRGGGSGGKVVGMAGRAAASRAVVKRTDCGSADSVVDGFRAATVLAPIVEVSGGEASAGSGEESICMPIATARSVLHAARAACCSAW